MARLFPHPLLSAVIVLFWALLANEVSAATLIAGAVVGWIIPLITSVYWPDTSRVRSPRAVLTYLAVVLKDIIISNVQVARLVLFRRGDSLRSQFITVPLDLSTAEAISALSGTITLTPGTLTADLSADGQALLVHCLETESPEEIAAVIKTRYEVHLKEIFE